jgi:iron(III) transport system permease protein
MRHLAAATLALYLLVVAVLPLAALAWASLQPWHRAPTPDALATLSLDAYRRLLDAPSVGRATANSVLLAIGSATLVVLLGVAVAYLVQRTRVAGRHALDALATLPVAMPGLVIGLSLMVVHLTLPTGLYGTHWILLVAYLTRFLPYGVRYASAALVHLDRELEDAARVSGAGRASTLRRIAMPLIAPALAAAWLYVFVMSARELSSSILLYRPGTEVLSVVLWELWENGQHPELGARGVVMVVALAALVVPADAMARRLASARLR